MVLWSFCVWTIFLQFEVLTNFNYDIFFGYHNISVVKATILIQNYIYLPKSCGSYKYVFF